MENTLVRVHKKVVVVVGFYIIEKRNMEVLCSFPINQQIQSPNEKYEYYIDFVLEFQKRAMEQYKTIYKSIEFSDFTVLFAEKYDFLFLLMGNGEGGLEIDYSLLAFFKNMFLTAFEIKNKRASRELLKELTEKKPFLNSTSLSENLMINQIVDMHVHEVDKKNLFECFQNLLVSLWRGLLFYLEPGFPIRYSELIHTIKNFIKYKLGSLQGLLNLSEEGLTFNEDKLVEKMLMNVKKECIMLFDFVISTLKEEFGDDLTRIIISYDLPLTVKNEWNRMKSLNLLKEIISIAWS